MTFPPRAKDRSAWVDSSKQRLWLWDEGDAKATQTLAGLVIVKCTGWARCDPTLGSLRPCLALSWETSYFLSWFLAIYIRSCLLSPRGSFGHDKNGSEKPQTTFSFQTSTTCPSAFTLLPGEVISLCGGLSVLYFQFLKAPKLFL